LKKRPITSGILLAISLLTLSACGGGVAATATVDTAPIYTEIASTALALQTQTALARPTATNTPQISPTSEATNAPLVTGTPAGADTPLPGTPSATSAATKTPPKATSQASCDNMMGVADITIPDGYIAAPGELMYKTWSIKNLGPCTWNKDYALGFAYGGEGTNWDATKPVNLDKVVNPGEIVEITVSLEAPAKKGTYGAYFKMMNDKGFYFGNVVWITIEVQ
jgi:Ig-like domain from next to BRCA1 gene